MSRYKRPDKDFQEQLANHMRKARLLSPAALYEMFERHSQCILVPRGKCPLLVFTTQLCEEINAFFQKED